MLDQKWPMENWWSDCHCDVRQATLQFKVELSKILCTPLSRLVPFFSIPFCSYVNLILKIRYL